jgi:hypothetical protein
MVVAAGRRPDGEQHGPCGAVVEIDEIGVARRLDRVALAVAVRDERPVR